MTNPPGMAATQGACSIWVAATYALGVELQRFRYLNLPEGAANPGEGHET